MAVKKNSSKHKQNSTLEGIAITHTGLEELAKKEISAIIEKDSIISRSVLTFPISDLTELCAVVYNGRLLRAVMLKITAFKLSHSDDIKNNIKADLFKDWITPQTTFAVRCQRTGEQDFSSQEIERELGEIIFEGLKAKVNLTNPDVTVLVYIVENDCYVGMDFAGIDLSKRGYRIFSYGDSLKGTVAQAMNYIADIKKKDLVLDPFSMSGTIAIEAVLYLTNKSPHYYNKEGFAFLKLPPLKAVDFEKFFKKEDAKIKEAKLEINSTDFMQKNVRSAEKNAKIAGVNKMINFSRMDIEWLDTKFEEGSVDKIITQPPQISKRTNPQQVMKLLDEFFYVSKVILSGKGLIVMLFNKQELLQNSLDKHGFRIAKTIDAWQGQECLNILVIEKAGKKSPKEPQKKHL